MNSPDLNRLVAIEDLRYLQSRYVRYADAKEWHLLAALFKPDGKFIPHGVDGEPTVSMNGREAIEQRVSSSVGSGTARHHLLSYEIDIDSPTSARGVWAMEDWIDRGNSGTDTGAPRGSNPAFKTMHGYGHYHALYEKVNGVWFIAELKLYRAKLDFTY